MVSKTKYEVAPDGLDARVVGPWVLRKDHYVDRIAKLFSTGMKNKWPVRGYIELFAGPGLSYDEDRHAFIEGSAMRALSRNFTHYAFVDIDDRATNALNVRIAGRPRIAVIQKDCNDAVADIRAAIPRNGLSLAFIDPTNWQVRLETIGDLVAGRRVDLLVTFHAQSMFRMKRIPSPELDAFFGTPEWRSALLCAGWERVDALLGLYNRQLSQFGYLESWRDRVSVRNRENRVIYQLAYFSKDERGVDFWRKAISGVDESGQQSFWDAA
jgi:three-Cys-motif partner protein